MSEERQRGVDLFNEAWRLIETREDDDRLLHVTHASRYHWGEAEECKPENLARGEWQVSRVYSVLGRPEPAIWHARRCLEHCEANGIGDWDLAYLGVRGARRQAEQWKPSSRAGDAIADAEDRVHFDEGAPPCRVDAIADARRSASTSTRIYRSYSL